MSTHMTDDVTHMSCQFPLTALTTWMVSVTHVVAQNEARATYRKGDVTVACGRVAWLSVAPLLLSTVMLIEGQGDNNFETNFKFAKGFQAWYVLYFFANLI